MARKPGHGRHRISTKDKVDIVHKLFIKHYPLAEVAKEYRISKAYACNLMSKARKNPKFLEEITSFEQEKADHLERIVAAVTDMNKKGCLLFTVH